MRFLCANSKSLQTTLFQNFRISWQYFPAFLPAIFVIAGNLAGGPLAAANMGFTLVLLVLVDFILPENRNANAEAANTLSVFWLVLASMVNLGCLVTLLLGVWNERISGGWIWAASISTGLNAGLLGLNTAHELIHRKNSLLQKLGILNLFCCCYAHFFIEHRLGHHVRVARPDDPATARKGEGFYRFLLRTIPGQWVSALKLAEGNVKKGRDRVNFVLLTSLASLIFIVVLFQFKTEIGFAFLLSSAMGIFLLEYVNYIEHYGLLRAEGERPVAEHAWQSDSLTSRFHLFELSRHSHHHMDAKVPYPELLSLESSKRLPFGYFGMFYIALIPPIWFRVMDKRI